MSLFNYFSICETYCTLSMVDQADYIIAVWNGKPSGTGKTVQYAQQQGKPVRVINPITLVVESI